MGSARDRAEAEAYAKFAAESRARDAKVQQQQAQQESAPRVIGSFSGMTAGNPPTMSVRERGEFRAAQEPEVLTPPRNAGGSGAFTEVNMPMSVRERQERRDGLSSMEPAVRRDANAESWLEFEKQQQKKSQQWERDRGNEQAAINTKNDETAKFNQRMLPVRLMLDQYDATESERKKIWDIAVKHPEFNTDKLYGTLLELRSCSKKPDWKI